MTDIIFPDWSDKTKRSYTKTKLGEPVIELTQAEVDVIGDWATERRAQILDEKDPA